MNYVVMFIYFIACYAAIYQLTKPLWVRAQLSKFIHLKRVKPIVKILMLVFQVLWIVPGVLTLWFLIPIFAAKSTRKTSHYAQDPEIQRYVMPAWCGWLNSPDEDGWPMYEPAITKAYKFGGWRWAMYVNLATRNMAQGVTWPLGVVVTEKTKLMSQANLEKLGLVSHEKIFLGLRWVYGYKTIQDWYGLKNGRPDSSWQTVGLIAVPRFTVRLASQD